MVAVLTPPADLTDDGLAAALHRSWGVTAPELAYRPVGFGSHHWEMADAGGTRWFVTIDELETKRHSRDEPLSEAFDRLRASLAAARQLSDLGYPFVVAPVPTGDGQPLAREERFGIALYPFVEGRSYGWDEWADAGHRRAVLDLVVAVHAAPAAVRQQAHADDFGVPHRDELEATLDAADDIGDGGPYARSTQELLRTYEKPLRRQLARYDALVENARAQPSRTVLTHGEPHPGNTMLSADGWRLIDWDTALVAPPERDLWGLDPGDGSILDAYADATGEQVLPSMLDLYRVRWDLADIAVEVSRFRGRHDGSADDTKSWNLLCAQVLALAEETAQ